MGIQVNTTSAKNSLETQTPMRYCQTEGKISDHNAENTILYISNHSKGGT